MTIKVVTIPRPRAPQPTPGKLETLRRWWRGLFEYRYTNGFSEA